MDYKSGKNGLFVAQERGGCTGNGTKNHGDWLQVWIFENEFAEFLPYRTFSPVRPNLGIQLPRMSAETRMWFARPISSLRGTGPI